jgi:hypothetical protein
MAGSSAAWHKGFEIRKKNEYDMDRSSKSRISLSGIAARPWAIYVKWTNHHGLLADGGLNSVIIAEL